MPSLQITNLDHTNPAVQQAIVDYLAPVEPHALFILGNINAGIPGSHYYLVERDGQWLGVVGYFDRFASMCPYCTDADATRALTAHVASLHGRIEYMNAIASVGTAAREELLRLGYTPANDPCQVLMEAPMPQPPAVLKEESLVRKAREGEQYAVADLMRSLTRPDDPSRPTQEETSRQILTYRYVLEADGQIIATASSNGLAIKCFQILGVVTHPDYRRRGYASAVCAALMRNMYADGARRAVLFTGVGNTSAQQCYQRLGFTITGDYLMAKFHQPQQD